MEAIKKSGHEGEGDLLWFPSMKDTHWWLTHTHNTHTHTQKPLDPHIGFPWAILFDTWRFPVLGVDSNGWNITISYTPNIGDDVWYYSTYIFISYTTWVLYIHVTKHNPFEIQNTLDPKVSSYERFSGGSHRKSEDWHRCGCLGILQVGWEGMVEGDGMAMADMFFF